MSTGKFEKVYDMLLAEIREAFPKVQFILLESFMLPGSATKREGQAERWETFSREVPLRAQAAKRLAEKYGAVYVPLQHLFDDCCKLMPADYWLFDGMHPTEAGHALIAREWMKAFEQLSWPDEV